MWAAFVGTARRPCGLVPLLHQPIGHWATVRNPFCALLFTPTLLELGDFAVAAFLGGRGRVYPFEPVDRAVLGDVRVVDTVEVCAQLLAHVNGLGVALGGNDRGGRLPEFDQGTRLGEKAFRGSLFVPAVTCPVLDARCWGVIPQGVQWDLADVGRGEQSGVKEFVGDIDQRVGGGGEAQTALLGRVDDGRKPSADPVGQLGAGVVPHHFQVRRAVDPLAQGQAAQHVFGMVEEVLVDVDGLSKAGCIEQVVVDEVIELVDVEGCGLDPAGGVLGFLRGVAAAQDEDVGDDFGAGHAFEGIARQADRAKQLSALGHGAARLGVNAVQGVAAGQDGDVAAGCGEVQRFEDEVVVDGEPLRVMRRIVDGEVSERDVADHRGEGVRRHAGSFEAFGADLSRRV